MATEQFSEWLIAKLNERGWNQAELSRRTGVSTAHISRILSGMRNPGEDTCSKIAHAMKIPEPRVFQIAGLMRARIIGDEHKQDLLNYFEVLDRQNQRTLINIAQTLYEQQTEYGENNERDT